MSSPPTLRAQSPHRAQTQSGQIQSRNSASIGHAQVTINSVASLPVETDNIDGGANYLRNGKDEVLTRPRTTPRAAQQPECEGPVRTGHISLAVQQREGEDLSRTGQITLAEQQREGEGAAWIGQTSCTTAEGY